MTRRQLAWKIAKAAAITVACVAFAAGVAVAGFIVWAGYNMTNQH